MSARLSVIHSAVEAGAARIEEILTENDKLSRELLSVNADAVDQERRFPRENLDALARSGIFGLLVPATYGGAGAGLPEMSQVLERMGQACASTAMITLMHFCGTAVLAATAPPKLKDAILPAIARGEHLTTLAFSEPGSGGHFYCPISQVLTNDGKMRLSAQKSFVTSAGEADSYVVSTRSASAKAATDVDLFLVDAAADGLMVAGQFDGLGLRGNHSAPMKLQNVATSEEMRIGAEASGFQTMLQVVLPHFQIGAASVFLGMAQSALEKTAAHLNSRKYEHLGGTPMAQIPRAQFLMGEMALDLRSTRAYLGETIRRATSGDSEAVLDILGIKARAADACVAVVSRAMTACGGTAYGRKGGLERIFRDAQAAPIMAPATDLLKEFLGKASLGLPLF